MLGLEDHAGQGFRAISGGRKSDDRAVGGRAIKATIASMATATLMNSLIGRIELAPTDLILRSIA
jgi:hypothetical protein